MKAILVIEMPKDCVECNQFAFECCHTMKREIERENIVQCKRPSWCPLRPMPEKIDIPFKGRANGIFTKCRGWNACVDAILGETE